MGFLVTFLASLKITINGALEIRCADARNSIDLKIFINLKIKIYILKKKGKRSISLGMYEIQE